MLSAGVGQFSITLQGKLSRGRSKTGRDEGTGKVFESRSRSEASTSPIATWLSNAFYGLPSDEDLRRTNELLSRSTDNSKGLS